MTTSTNKPIGVLIMAYGGPNSLEEIPGYLADIRNGRPTNTAVLDEITNNYRQIGGKSPLLEFTEAQIDAIRAHLDPNKYKLYLGMRHWAPWIEDTIRDMLDDGIEQAVSMVLAPHYSKLSIQKYQKKI
ncbi:MAG: ferrochelatase, partial [Chloroflexota bacterium]